MELSLSTANRLANSALGATPAVAGIVYLAQANGPYARLAACLATVAFAITAVRGYRLGATLEPGRLTVRGYLRTRVIGRGQITEITDFPAVRWTDHSGRRRWTPVTALISDSGETAGVQTAKARNLAALRRWAGR